jgi:adenine phosphoribosyltransferase
MTKPTSKNYSVEDLKKLIRDIPDFPKKGIVFKDITPLLGDPKGFKAAIDLICEPFLNKGIHKVAGIESRGFLLATAIAYKLNAGVIPVRKKGKLPHKVVSTAYALEYGSDCVEAHEDALKPGEKILLVDDVLATGGTASATCTLLGMLHANIVGTAFLIELDFLKGREKLKQYKIHSLIHY